jgi:uracil-DNA glycosylase family 4
MAKAFQNPYAAALQWHIDLGADEAMQDIPFDRTALPPEFANGAVAALEALSAKTGAALQAVPSLAAMPAPELLGTADAKVEAVRIARDCQTLEELQAAIAAFEGLAIKKTATNMVFAEGNPKARVMLIGEAPGAEEDRQGRPFSGPDGQLLDRILGSIGLSRVSDDPSKAVYISNILNWRPPGNRTPSPAEIDISIPFIERHIALVKPEFLILCGGVAAKGLLGTSEGISKLRGKFSTYQPITDSVATDIGSIRALATYHPTYLLRTPSQKKLVWHDMLMLQSTLEQN